MILSVAEYRLLNPNDSTSDSALEAKLQGLETLVRAHTNNNFQQRNIRFYCPVISGKLFYTTNYVSANDTVQISESALNDGLYTITAKAGDVITLNQTLYDEDYVLVTKIVYPPDVKIGVANMLRWENENREKVGVASETLSRHSVTYFNMDGDNSLMGYPKSLVGFLKPYVKARF